MPDEWSRRIGLADMDAEQLEYGPDGELVEPCNHVNDCNDCKRVRVEIRAEAREGLEAEWKDGLEERMPEFLVRALTEPLVVEVVKARQALMVVCAEHEDDCGCEGCRVLDDGWGWKPGSDAPADQAVCTCGHIAHWHSAVVELDGKLRKVPQGAGDCDFRVDCDCKRFEEAPDAAA